MAGLRTIAGNSGWPGWRPAKSSFLTCIRIRLSRL
jgi:hypothetical protein